MVTYRSEQINRILRTMHKTVEEIEASVVVNIDGLLVEAYPPNEDDTTNDQVAAMTATVRTPCKWWRNSWGGLAQVRTPKNGNRVRPNEACVTAFKCVEAFEKGHVSEKDFEGLSREVASVLADLTVKHAK